MAPSSTGHRRRQPPRPLKRDNELPPASGKRRPCRDVAMVRSSQALRCLQGQSALYTLIHQRHPAPSCGGHAPTAERTMDPARNFKKENFTERLDPRPGIREQPGSKAETSDRAQHFRFAPNSDRLADAPGCPLSAISDNSHRSKYAYLGPAKYRAGVAPKARRNIAMKALVPS
jgi:hypothetical protein